MNPKIMIQMEKNHLMQKDQTNRDLQSIWHKKNLILKNKMSKMKMLIPQIVTHYKENLVIKNKNLMFRHH